MTCRVRSAVEAQSPKISDLINVSMHHFLDLQLQEVVASAYAIKVSLLLQRHSVV